MTLVGLSGSGKTTLIQSLLNSQEEIFPTAGINIKYLSSGLKPILAYDCSGEPRAMSNWNMFTQIADSVIYVIDSSDN